MPGTLEKRVEPKMWIRQTKKDQFRDIKAKAGQGQNQVSAQNLDEQNQRGKGEFWIWTHKEGEVNKAQVKPMKVGQTIRGKRAKGGSEKQE